VTIVAHRMPKNNVVIVYGTAHDDTTRQGIEQYLATKYGVSI